jgi:hypothetical protein
VGWSAAAEARGEEWRVYLDKGAYGADLSADEFECGG